MYAAVCSWLLFKKPSLSKVKLIPYCLLISSSLDSNNSNSCSQDMHSDMVQSRHVENSGHTDRRGSRISGHYTKEIWSLSQLCSLSLPSLPRPCHPPKGVKHSLVMTMLQTALLSLGALLEQWCNSAKKASACGREWSFFRRKLTVCGAWQPQGAPQLCLGSDALPGKVLRWLGEDVGASGKRRCCKKKNYPSQQVIHTYTAV